MTMKENVTGLAHVGIPVADMEKTLEWYVGLLGFEVVYEKHVEEIDCHAAFVRKGDLEFEFCEYGEEKSKELAALDHGHIDHIAIAVKDVYKAFEEMKKTGCEMLDAEVQTLPLYDNGVAWFMVVGPNGEKVEFNQVL